DFDLLVTMPDGRKVCAETKCKVEAGSFSENTIINSLDEARARNLPSDRPGIIFAKLPVEWITDENHTRLVEVTGKFFSRTQRVVSVKYYSSYIFDDPLMIREAMSWFEIANRRNRFDAKSDWRLFPDNAEVAQSWNGMPPHWHRILDGAEI